MHIQHGHYVFSVDSDIEFLSYRVMPPRRNPRRERTAERPSAEASHAPPDERGGDATVSVSSSRQ